MKTILKAALGALAVASVGALASTPANAQSFGFSFGSPYYGGGYYSSCYGPYRFRPAYCFRRPGPAYYSGPAYYYGRPAYRPYAYYGFHDRGHWNRGHWRR